MFMRRKSIIEMQDELTKFSIHQMGFGPVGDIRMVYSSGTANPYLHFRSKVYEGALHGTLALAVAAMAANRNDVCLLTPENHSLAETLVWSKAITHLVGLYPSAMMNQRARIGHSANFNNLITISGVGCSLTNIYLMHGRGSATNLTGLNIAANRLTMKHCHVAGPLHATEGDEAAYALVKIGEASGGDGLEHYFNHCTFGTDTVAWTDGDMFKISGTPRLVFEDCMLLMRPDNAQVTFLDGTAGDGAGFVLFKNTVGLNLGTALTVAIGSTGLAAATKFFLDKSGFLGSVDVIAAADEAKVVALATPGNATDDIFAGLGLPFDHTA